MSMSSIRYRTLRWMVKAGKVAYEDLRNADKECVSITLSRLVYVFDLHEVEKLIIFCLS